MNNKIRALLEARHRVYNSPELSEFVDDLQKQLGEVTQRLVASRVTEEMYRLQGDAQRLKIILNQLSEAKDLLGKG